MAEDLSTPLLMSGDIDIDSSLQEAPNSNANLGSDGDHFFDYDSELKSEFLRAQ